MAEPDWMHSVRALVGKDYGRVYGWDAVNTAMARQYAEVMGLDMAVYGDGTRVPASMLQVWCMEGPQQNHYPPGSTTENPYEALKLIEAQGYPSVVAVNSELEFDRPLVPGERLYYTTRLDSISEQKTTALGTGWFVTLVMTYCAIGDGVPDGKVDDKVGQLLFRVFKFKPANPVKPADAATPAAPPKPKRPPPGISDDTRFFWDGAREGRLLIQRCTGCGTLRHPPGPVCPKCHAFEWDTLQASGLGTVYSFVVMHHPEVPPFDHPNPIGLIELDEGTRLVAQLVGVKPADVAIGQRVRVEFNTFDGDLVLPQFRPLA